MKKVELLHIPEVDGELCTVLEFWSPNKILLKAFSFAVVQNSAVLTFQY